MGTSTTHRSANHRDLETGDIVYANVAGAERKCVVVIDGDVYVKPLDLGDDYGVVKVDASATYYIGAAR